MANLKLVISRDCLRGIRKTWIVEYADCADAVIMLRIMERPFECAQNLVGVV